MNIPAWATLGIVTSLLFGIVNMLDKTILSRYKLNPWDYLALDGIIGILPLIIVPVWFDNPFIIPKQTIAFAMLSGLALGAFYIIYFYALKRSNVAVVVILIQISPVFSLIWGLTILHEFYSTLAYIGMFLVLLGAGVASVGTGGGEGAFQREWFTKILPTSLIMLGASFVLSIGYLVQKISLGDASVLSVFFWQRLCLFLIALPIIGIRINKAQRISPTAVPLASMVEVLNLLALLAMVTAYSKGPLGGVTFLISLQPLWVLVFVWIMSSIKPTIIPVNGGISRIKVLVACILVLSGLFLMRFN